MKNWTYSQYKQNKYFRRILKLMFCLVLVTFVLLGFTFYFTLTTKVKEQTKKQSRSNFELSITRLEAALDEIENLAFLLGSSEYVSSLFSNEKVADNISDSRSLKKNMAMVQSYNKKCERILLYYPKMEGLFDTERGYSYYELSEHKELIDYITENNNLQNDGWLNLGEDSSYSTELIYYKMLPNVAAHMDGLLIFIVNKEVFQNLIEVTNYYGFYQETYLLDSLGNVLISSSDVRYRQQVSEKVLELLESTDDGLVETVQTVRNTEFIINPLDQNRIYISASNYDHYIMSIFEIYTANILALLPILLISLIVAYLISNYAYKPVEDLLTYSKDLDELDEKKNIDEFAEIKKNFIHIKQDADVLNTYVQVTEPLLQKSFYILLFSKHYQFSQEHLREECKLYNIPFDKQSIVTVVHIEDKQVEESSVAEKFKDAVIEKLRTLLKGYKQIGNNMVFFYEKKIVIISHFDVDSQQERDLILGDYKFCFNELKQWIIDEDMGINIWIGIGNICVNMMDINESYKKALDNVNENIYTNSQIKPAEEMSLTNNNLVFYPEKIVEQLINYLNKGNQDWAIACFEEFVGHLKDGSYIFLKYSFSKLLSDIVYAYDRKGRNILELLRDEDAGHFNDCETLREYRYYFMKLLIPKYIMCINIEQENSLSSCILRICNDIRNNPLAAMSLSQYSDMTGINISLLSTQFKTEAGKNFVDFLNINKIEEIKKILVTTDIPLSKVAEMVNYSERSLYRVFVKYTKISPNEYRTKYRKKESK